MEHLLRGLRPYPESSTFIGIVWRHGGAERSVVRAGGGVVSSVRPVSREVWGGCVKHSNVRLYLVATDYRRYRRYADIEAFVSERYRGLGNGVTSPALRWHCPKISWDGSMIVLGCGERSCEARAGRFWGHRFPSVPVGT